MSKKKLKKLLNIIEYLFVLKEENYLIDSEISCYLIELNRTKLSEIRKLTCDVIRSYKKYFSKIASLL